MKIFKRVLKFLIWFILGIMLIYNLYTYISINILKQDLPSINGYATLEVVSGSMHPNINMGDLIIIDKKYKKYKKNDIITFKDTTSTFVTHRIVRIEGNKIITKGDYNDAEDDGYITKKQIVGKYVFKISTLGYIIKSIKNPVTLILVFIMGIIVCIIVSTDKEGVPLDISDEEKEFLKLKEERNKKEKKSKKKRR